MNVGEAGGGTGHPCQEDWMALSYPSVSRTPRFSVMGCLCQGACEPEYQGKLESFRKSFVVPLSHHLGQGGAVLSVCVMHTFVCLWGTWVYVDYLCECVCVWVSHLCFTWRLRRGDLCIPFPRTADGSAFGGVAKGLWSKLSVICSTES